MASRRRLEKYGEDYQRPKVFDLSDVPVLLPALLLVLGVVALVAWLG